MIPEKVIDALEKYVEQGISPGAFLAACLCNDLRQALFLSLDDYKITEYLDEIVDYIYTNLPLDSRGSRERYDQWIYKKTFLEKVGNK